MAQHVYHAAFMRITSQSRHSAEAIVAHVARVLSVRSVADFGCALGTWLSVWHDRGVDDIVGVDGEYLRGKPLEVDLSCIRFRDLTQPIDLGRKFDLVESLEVAEHLPAEAAPSFVATLARHGDIILFSAAPPGQGGEYHVNEQAFEYWRDLFATHGYRMFDWIRPKIVADESIRFWYRYNLFLFVHERALAMLPREIAGNGVATKGPIRDVSPLQFRLRKLVVRRLPVFVQTRIAATLSKLGGS